MSYLISKSQMEMSKVPSGVIYLKSSLCFFNLSACATNLFVPLRGITSYIKNFFTRIYRATNKLYSYVLNNFNTANNIIKLISKYKFGICLILFNLLIIGSIIRFWHFLLQEMSLLMFFPIVSATFLLLYSVSVSYIKDEKLSAKDLLLGYLLRLSVGWFFIVYIPLDLVIYMAAMLGFNVNLTMPVPVVFMNGLGSNNNPGSGQPSGEGPGGSGPNNGGGPGGGPGNGGGPDKGGWPGPVDNGEGPSDPNRKRRNAEVFEDQDNSYTTSKRIKTSVPSETSVSDSSNSTWSYQYDATGVYERSRPRIRTGILPTNIDVRMITWINGVPTDQAGLVNPHTFQSERHLETETMTDSTNKLSSNDKANPNSDKNTSK